MAAQNPWKFIIQKAALVPQRPTKCASFAEPFQFSILKFSIFNSFYLYSQMANWKIEFAPDVDLDDVRFLIRKLEEHNHAQSPSEYKRNDLRLFVRDQNGRIVGGLLGLVNMHCLVVQIVWLEEDYRGQGIGEDLVRQCEERGKELGALQSIVETTDFQARPFYERLGYKVIASVPNVPKGSNLHILHKPLT
jgi:GNAT superfamily N-acetyltransferase